MDIDGRTPELWYRSLPTLTKCGLTITFFVTLAATLRLFNPVHLLLDWDLVVRKLQLWRLFTDYSFAGAFSIGWIFHLYFFVTFSAKLEVNEIVTRGPGAYLTFLIFQAIILDILSLLLYWPTGLPMMCRAGVMAIIYYWSKKEAYSPVGLWGFTIQAYQFPWALLFLDLIMGQSLWGGFMGISSGHLYYVVRDLLPEERGIYLLGKSPQFCDQIMRRLVRFDFNNIPHSLNILIHGIEAVEARSTDPVSFPRAASAEAPNRVRERPLFTGTGHRLGERSSG